MKILIAIKDLALTFILFGILSLISKKYKLLALEEVIRKIKNS